MSDLGSVAVGAALGFGAGLLTEFWKSDREDIRELCSGFCAAVRDSADAGARFWLTPGRDPDAPFQLANLAGCQGRLDGYSTVLFGRLDGDRLDVIDQKLAVLYQKLTGDDPEDPQRLPMPQRAVEIHAAANEVTVAIRLAFYFRMSAVQRLYRWAANSRVNQPTTMQLPPENPFPGRP